jgi:hypothetical protein
MALQRVVIDGYGQLELNAVAFRRSGRIEAQCALDATDFKEVPAENGMLLAVDNVNRVVKFVKSGNVYPIALNYTTEHMYDERHNALKDFKLELGEFYPRMGYIGPGDKYTTNCLAYDTADFANEEALMTALDNIKTAPLYAKACALGAHQITKTKTDAVALVIAKTTMPDGQVAVKFQAL